HPLLSTHTPIHSPTNTPSTHTHTYTHTHTHKRQVFTVLTVTVSTSYTLPHALVRRCTGTALHITQTHTHTHTQYLLIILILFSLLLHCENILKCINVDQNPQTTLSITC